jgi:AcrR family transcriptional regulator
MLDQTTPKGRIIAAALRLAGERPWKDVTIRDIAEAAGASLVEMRRDFASKGAILAAFARAVDDELLTTVPTFTADQAPRDRIFDVIMKRFELLEPYKGGLKSIAASGPAGPQFMKGLCASQAWMLNAAGIGTDGVLGAARVAGLACVYASAFRTWLEDDDPGLARTMAAVDRRLRRGEQALGILDDVCSAACRVAEALKPGVRRTDQAEPPPAAPSSPPASA